MPPPPDQSRRDIAATERGEARLVACYLRDPQGRGQRGRAGWLAMVPLNLGALLTVMFLSGGFRAWRHRRNAPERPGHKGTK